MKIDNVRIKDVTIGIETGVSVHFHDEGGALSQNPSPYFIVRAPEHCRSEAERLGWEIIAICWVLDHWHHLHAENEVIRVKHENGHVRAIGHAVQDRWLGESYTHLVYPYYTGVERPMPKKKPSKKKK